MSSSLVFKTGLSLIIGGLGGWVFAWARLPLPWMLGAMAATTAVALLGGGIAMPKQLRNLLVTVLGVLLGSAFTPEIVDHLRGWLAAFAALAIYVAVSTTLGFLYFHHVGKLDRITAFFASTPGGLGEMTMVGESMGADARHVSLCHATRVLIVVMTIPLYFRFFMGYVPPEGGVAPLQAALDARDVIVLTGCGLIGWWLGRKAKMPAAQLLGPMILSAIAHFTGLTQSRPPSEIVALAQVAIGTSVGARFAGLDLRAVGRTFVAATGWAVALLLLTVVSTGLIEILLGMDRAPTLLVMAPGGLAEMTLIALALGIDVAFVSTLHLLRIALIAVFAPLIFRALGWRPNSVA